MQHTDKYKLNLIERDDPFSPDALNENTQKVENALAAHQAGVAAELDARITKFASGYAEKGSSTDFVVHLPFKPKAVIVHGGIGTATQAVLIAVTPGVIVAHSSYRLTMTEDGFQVGWGTACNYIAFG